MQYRHCRATERKPRRVSALKGINIVQAAIGGWHCLAVDDQNQAYAWGGNEYSQCGVDSAPGTRDIVHPQPCLPGVRVVQVSAGGMHSCALTDSGEVGSLQPPQHGLLPVIAVDIQALQDVAIPTPDFSPSPSMLLYVDKVCGVWLMPRIVLLPALTEKACSHISGHPALRLAGSRAVPCLFI